MSAPDIAAVRQRMEALAGNLAYGWRHSIRMPFFLIGEEAFDAVHHNPTALLRATSDEHLALLASSAEFQRRLELAEESLLDETRPGGGWWKASGDADTDSMLVAYFSAEFGVDESLPIYSGGLGVLAGDHLKASSELELSLVGVGLLYREGYFRQAIDEYGQQRENYKLNDPSRMPVSAATDTTGAQVVVDVELDGDTVSARVWKAVIGRITLLLLDTDVDGNSERGRAVTDRLYGGDREQRIRQEMVLGVGGVRALRALGHAPTVWHMNEGHAGFMQFERLRELAAEGMSFADALERIKADTVFTTHTPVPAGNEVFDAELVHRYTKPWVAAIGEDAATFDRLASFDGDGFGMTPFALRTSTAANGVAKLHGEVSREMWKSITDDAEYPGAPIGHVTNGVHSRTFISHELSELLRSGGVHQGVSPDESHWEKVRDLPSGVLWAAHRSRKMRLFDTARRRYMNQAGATAQGWNFHPNVLTIGFARRFATYKRAGLLMSDPERLSRLMSDPDRPVQFLFAGKAHPADVPGKELIEHIVDFSKRPEVHGRMVFLDDYEIVLAKRLVQGVDVWLNTPRRPMEASGTSGMKAAMNGALNASILDGWWPEGYVEGQTGFAIGTDAVDDDEHVQDGIDVESLYDVLENQLVPAYYDDRDEFGVSATWTSMMKESIAQLAPKFDASRMVCDYADQYYVPAHARSVAAARGAARA